MINTMLDIAEAETGVMNLAMAPVDITALLRDACELYEPLAAENGVKIALDVEESVAWGDAQRIQRVVANLLDNAIKYTPRNRNHYRCPHPPSTAPTRQISVTNTGDGISPKDLPNIFKRFYRARQESIGLR